MRFPTNCIDVRWAPDESSRLCLLLEQIVVLYLPPTQFQMRLICFPILSGLSQAVSPYCMQSLHSERLCSRLPDTVSYFFHSFQPLHLLISLFTYLRNFSLMFFSLLFSPFSSIFSHQKNLAFQSSSSIITYIASPDTIVIQIFLNRLIESFQLFQDMIFINSFWIRCNLHL